MLNVTGRVPHASVIAALAAADVVVFPSVYPESFGIVNLEAMAAGVPVVSFAAGGASDYTTDGARRSFEPNDRTIDRRTRCFRNALLHDWEYALHARCHTTSGMGC